MHTWNWSKDPDIRGAYSYIPVNGLDLPGTLAAPVGDTLFFAGEALVADAQTGTVFGALESGLRAAREVLRVLRKSRGGKKYAGKPNAPPRIQRGTIKRVAALSGLRW
jgi:monoamine oxidase